MGRKSLYLSFDAKGRCRLSVELDDSALEALTKILASFGPRGLAPSHSQIVRAALISFAKSKDYSSACGLPFLQRRRPNADQAALLGDPPALSDIGETSPSGLPPLPRGGR